mmetsp:Transcript_4678/g.6977  ORF Transcript_4678/g.6977 Transcript_4678/m.6977 type:complete len:257 (-) Transcript_4678:1140-1910(-)
MFIVKWTNFNRILSRLSKDPTKFILDLIFFAVNADDNLSKYHHLRFRLELYSQLICCIFISSLTSNFSRVLNLKNKITDMVSGISMYRKYKSIHFSEQSRWFGFVSELIRHSNLRPFSFVTPLIGSHLFRKCVDSYHLHIPGKRPFLPQTPLLHPIEHAVRVDHLWFGFWVTQHALDSIQNHFHDVVMNGSFEKPIDGLPELRVVSPDIVMVQHVHSRREDVIARCPQPSRHGDLLTHEDIRQEGIERHFMQEAGW